MSFFNRPKWAKSVTSDADQKETDEASLFSHTNRSYNQILADPERKRREQEERRRRKLEKESSKKSIQKESKTRSSGRSSPKRRRISVNKDDDQDLGDSAGISADRPKTEGVNQELFADEERDLHVRRSPRKTRHVDNPESLAKGQPDKLAQPIVLDDSDPDDLDVPLPPQAPSPKPVPVETIHDDPDDEFAELARQARAKRLHTEQGKNNHSTSDTLRDAQSPSLSTRDDRQESSPADPIISLLITSRIPETKQLIVQRRLSQRLQEVREAWCHKQGFSPEFMRNVFFVHRMRRAYDVTTCRSLGLHVDEFGNLAMKGAEGKEGVERVHLEAVTEDIFRQIKEEREMEIKRKNGELPPLENNMMADGVNASEPPAKEESLIRVTLKAKGREDFKLKVKPTTKFSRILGSYAKIQKIDPAEAVLKFDGDDLDPEDEVQDSEVTDLDCIDVHISS